MKALQIAVAAGALAAITVLGCSKNKEDAKGHILALVAASTREAAQEIADAFTRDTGTEIQISADDSSKLATQIINGAPADLFLSANEEWAKFVKKNGFAAEVVPLLGNTLVLVVPRGNPGRVSKPEELTGPTVKKVALAGPSVPAGIYGRQALQHLNLLEVLESERKVVAGENVRVTLAYVERGEAEAGIVYGTDARITDQVEVTYTFSPSTHERIVYPLVLTRSGASNESARKFYEYLQAAQAKGVFEKHGFTFLAGP
jgi:molybdate transport system substrate-binding protein